MSDSNCGRCGAPSLYRCPACNARSCSLDCVRKHKADTGCSGVRSKTEFRPMSDFDDATLARDYHFLESVIRDVDSGKRRLNDTEVPSARPGQKLTPARHHLFKQAKERGIGLEMLPHGMQRQRDNTSRYDGRRRRICWRVELRFEGASVLHVLPAVPESCTIRQVLRSLMEPGETLVAIGAAKTENSGSVSGCGFSGDAHGAPSSAAISNTASGSALGVVSGARQVSRADGHDGDDAIPSAGADTSSRVVSTKYEPGPARSVQRDQAGSEASEGTKALLRHKLRSYCVLGVDRLVAFMRVEHRPANEPRYYRMPLEATLSEALRDKIVLEFPTLHIAAAGTPEEAAFLPPQEVSTSLAL